MSRFRASFRFALDLPAQVFVPDDRGPGTGLPAKVFDLSRTGIALAIAVNAHGTDPDARMPCVGQTVCVAVHDVMEGCPAIRQWLGRVARAEESGQQGFRRLGIEFDLPTSRGARAL